MKRINMIIMALIVVTLLIPIAGAVGIIHQVDDFQNKNPDLKIIEFVKGQDTYKTHLVKLSNGDDSGIVVKFIFENNTIAKVRDIKPEYAIPAHSKQDILFDINIPENAQIGDRWRINFSIIPKVNDVQGQVVIDTETNEWFDVVVVEKAGQIPVNKPSSINLTNLAIIGLFIAGIVGIAWLVSKKMNKEK